MEIFESLLAGLRTVCAEFPDARRSPDPEVDYSMADIGLSAFSLFFMQSESFLSFQGRLEKGHGTSNCHSLFGMKKIPTDNYIRLMLDPVSPEALQPCFDQVIEQLRERDGLKVFQRLAGRTLVALDGTEYFCSQKLSCPQCLTRKRANGKCEHYHAMLAATIVAPGHNMVLPLMPEFITPQDGAEKQDCERNAAKRWLNAHQARMADLRPVSSRRRPVQLPAAGRSGARQRSGFSVCVQERRPQNVIRVYRGSVAGPAHSERAQARQAHPHLSLPLDRSGPAA